MRKIKFPWILLSASILLSCQGNMMSMEFPNYGRKLESHPLKGLPYRPNIVWLVAEDLSPILPAYGDSTVQTPSLDMLAAEGVRYTNAFSPSGVCAPSRLALATGMYPSGLGGHNMRVQYVKSHMDQLGMVLYEVVPPPEVKMMSQVLRENGYYCTNNDKTDYQFQHPVTAWDESSLQAHWRDKPAGMPFFAVFNFGVTHEGHVTSPYRKQLMRYLDPDFPVSSQNKADFGEMILPEEWDLNIPPDSEVPVPPYLPVTEKSLQDVRRVYSNIVELDRQVGVILRQLEEDGLMDSTVVFFYSDHGGPLPRQKRLIYDSGIKVPLIIRYPGQAGAGAYDDQLISFIDFAPTAFSIAGIRIPAHVQGQAFLGKSKSGKPRKYIHAAADRFDAQVDMIRAVRDKQYKYLRNFHPDKPYYLPVKYREQMGIMQELLRLHEQDSLNGYQAQWFRDEKPGEELFDTWNDPHELQNLAEDPGYFKKLVELREECDHWMSRIHDMGNIPEKEILEMFWPEGIQPETEPPEFSVQGGRVVLKTATRGASIGYQIWHKDQRIVNTWLVYQEPIPIQPDATILAIAHRLGFKPSETIKFGFK
ncbi:MAG: sulfatase [Cyclobacteriaceae bacterium]|nr:sulfatase [Cyclobacteriaceae bacterium]